VVGNSYPELSVILSRTRASLNRRVHKIRTNCRRRCAEGMTRAARASFVMPRVSVRRASIDAEMIDFQSRERILAVVTSKQGRRIFSRRRGMKKKWGDVEAVLKSPPGGHVITLVKAYQGFRTRPRTTTRNSCLWLRLPNMLHCNSPHECTRTRF